MTSLLPPLPPRPLNPPPLKNPPPPKRRLAQALGGVGIVVDADLRDLVAASTLAAAGRALGAALPAQANALGHRAIQARAHPRLTLFRCQHGIEVFEKLLAHPRNASERLVELVTLRGTAAEVENLSKELFGDAPLFVHDEGDSLHLLLGERQAGVLERPGERVADLVERVLNQESILLLGERGTGNQH